MAKCMCEESRSSNPRWRIMAQNPAGRGYKYRIVCLSCEWDWWSSAQDTSTLPRISEEELQQLGPRFGKSELDST